MDRQKMLDALAEMGFPTDQVTDAIPDELLASTLQWVQGQMGGDQDEGQPVDDDQQPGDRDNDNFAEDEDDKSKDDDKPSEDDKDKDKDTDDDSSDADGDDDTTSSDDDDQDHTDHGDLNAETGGYEEGDQDRGPGAQEDVPTPPGESDGSDVDRGPDAQQDVQNQDHTDHDDGMGAGGDVNSYAEMTREEMCAGLEKMGHDKAELDAMPDTEIESLYNSEAGGSTDEPGQEPANANQMSEYADTPQTDSGDDVSRDQMVAQLVAHGHTQDDLNQLDDGEIKALYHAEMSGGDDDATQHSEFADDGIDSAEHAPGNLHDDPQTTDPRYNQNQMPPGGTLTPQVNKMSEKAIVNVARQAVREALQQEFGAVNQAIGTVKAQTHQLLQIPKRQSISKFCEDLVSQGKLLRSQVASVKARLLRASESTAIRKFSDKKNPGKFIQKSELELQMEELESHPSVVSFAERVAQPVTSTLSEVGKLKNYYRRFSENFKRKGVKFATLRDGFKAARKRNPQLTAHEYTGSEAAA